MDESNFRATREALRFRSTFHLFSRNDFSRKAVSGKFNFFAQIPRSEGNDGDSGLLPPAL